MTKEQFIALGLTEEQAEKAAAASAEELKAFIPKARFDEVNTAKKKAEDDLKDRDKQLEDLKKSSGDAETLKQQIEKLQGENKTAKEKYEADMKALKLDTALKLALGSQVHDADYAISQLNKDAIQLNDDGTVKSGLDDQIKALRESKAFLFVPEDNNKPKFKGAKPPEGGAGGGGNPDTSVGASFAKTANESGKTPAEGFNPWG